ncbi:porin [Verminephrobacter eiseniae]|uniref:porin n=1 Tax=Verminephrobacter eiseniae TaxID=364317 RepID=UPI002237392A|nr:porin [Verminephrobacter eiseniae]MCW5236097.1 porin [Verminephrobacter eiseniae]
MKKSLMALAVLAASGAAMAQSSVTLFGVLDATYAYGSGSLSNKSQLTNSGLSSSRLGFRGTEDMGGGLSASFWIEAGVNNDDGTGATTDTNNQATSSGGGGLTFNRRSTVSMSGGFGEVRLGRDYTPQFMNLTVFDPFGTNGVGTTQTLISSVGGPTRVRASNSIGYFLPGNLGGFYGQAMYYLGENSSSGSNKKDGNGLGLRAGYKNGPIDAALAFSQTKYLAGDIKTVNLGGQYDLGIVKLMAQYSQDKDAKRGTGKGMLAGGTVPMGPGEIDFSYSTYKLDVAGPVDPRTNLLAVGYTYNLSKRTALYTTFARASNKGGATIALAGATTAANTNSNGYNFGLRHSF